MEDTEEIGRIIINSITVIFSIIKGYMGEGVFFHINGTDNKAAQTQQYQKQT